MTAHREPHRGSLSAPVCVDSPKPDNGPDRSRLPPVQSLTEYRHWLFSLSGSLRRIPQLLATAKLAGHSALSEDLAQGVVR